MSCTLKVYGRLRPSANDNQDLAVQLIGKQQARVCPDGKAPKLYELHRFFEEQSTQVEVFNAVAATLVKECTDGINGTIFAYGQTGSGKTHTMLGPSQAWSDPEAKGLIPRSIDMLFDHLEKRSQECQQLKYSVTAQFVELYNEEIFDLLSAKSKITLSDTGSEVHLLGAKTEEVETSLDLMHVVKTGWMSRSTGATAMNRDSSRSHAMLIVKISTIETIGDLRTRKTSTLNLVDLAGSERQAHTKATGDRFKEATNINGSLTILGRVIRLLGKPATASGYIPYRDCHLTHILKNSLGGNSKTVVIVNMHPDKKFLHETSSTLQFAETCTFIKNKVHCNVEMSGDQESSYKNAIRALRLEIEETRAKTREESAKRLEALSEENASLKTENLDLRAKYNRSLFKYANRAEDPTTTSRFTQLLATTSRGDSSAGDLHSKLETVTLELDASETRVQKLQTELDELRDRYQERLNFSFQTMTPGKPRRSSSRSQRRETQYYPSPARLAEIAQQNDEEELQEMQMRLEQAEMEAEKRRSQLEQANEEKVMAEARFDEEKAKLTSRCARLEEELVESQSYGDDMAGKVVDCRNQLDKLLFLITEKDAVIAKLNADRRELEKKWSSDMDDMQKHYESLIAEAEKKIDSFQKNDEQRQQASGELEDKVAEATATIASLQDKLVQNNSKLNQAVVENASRHETVDLLQSNIRHLKIQLEDSQKKEERVQRSLAAAKEQQQANFDNFQKEVAAARAKTRKEVEDREESIALLRKALESKDELSEKLKSDARKRFDDKIAELKASFAVQKEEAIEEAVDNAKRAAQAAHKIHVDQLQQQISDLRKMREDDSAVINGQLSNKAQKHSYVDKLRKEAVEKDAEISSLRNQLQQKCAEGRRVLRSQNK